MFLSRYRNTSGRLGPILAALMLLHICPRQAGAQDAAPASDTLRGASVNYLEGDYEGALTALAALLDRTELTATEQARAHELSAFCELALDHKTEAHAHVRFMLEADRSHTMQEAWMEERMEKLVDEVTAELVEEDARAAEEARRAAAVAAGETPVPIDPDEGDEKGGGKTLYYVAGGVAALLILGAVLGGKEESSDTLTVLSLPPARPDPGP